MPDFPDWLTGGVDPRRLAEHVIENAHRWDWKDWEHAYAELSALAAASDTLSDFAPTGRPLMADVFMALKKVQPRLRAPEGVRPDHLVNRLVMGELVDLTEYLDLHPYTTGDDVAAGMACATLEPDVEELLDRQDKRQKEADGLQQLLEELAQAMADVGSVEQQIDELIAEWTRQRDEEGADGEETESEDGEDAGEGEGEGDEGADGEGEGEGEGQGDGGLSGIPGGDALAGALAAAQAKADDLVAQANALAQQLLQGFKDNAIDVRRSLAKGLGKAAAEARSLTDSALAWGTEMGQLKRMPADERLALAKRLNTDRNRKIAEKFGQIKMDMTNAKARMVPYVHTDLVDLEIGGDLSRVLPAEIVRLADPDLEMSFYADLADGKLLQYRMEGEERVGKGGIILCEDGSGSMKGEPELWAKAIMLFLLHTARQQNRAFYLLHFGSPGELYPFEFTQPEHFSTDRILAAAEMFCGGGTDFQTPLTAATERLQAEFASKGRVEGDIVMLTDGLCGVRPDWMKWFKDEQAKLRFDVWGIAVGHVRARSSFAALAQTDLGAICDGKIATTHDLLGAGDIADVFAPLAA